MKLQTSGRTSLCVRRSSATWRTVTSLKNFLFMRGGATAASVAANAALLRQMPFNTRTTARCASYVPNELPPLTRLDATAETVPTDAIVNRHCALCIELIYHTTAPYILGYQPFEDCCSITLSCRPDCIGTSVLLAFCPYVLDFTLCIEAVPPCRQVYLWNEKLLHATVFVF